MKPNHHALDHPIQRQHHAVEHDYDSDCDANDLTCMRIEPFSCLGCNATRDDRHAWGCRVDNAVKSGQTVAPVDLTDCAALEIKVHPCGTEQARFHYLSTDDVGWTDDIEVLMKWVRDDIEKVVPRYVAQEAAWDESRPWKVIDTADNTIVAWFHSEIRARKYTDSENENNK